MFLLADFIPNCLLAFPQKDGVPGTPEQMFAHQLSLSPGVLLERVDFVIGAEGQVGVRVQATFFMRKSLERSNFVSESVDFAARNLG